MRFLPLSAALLALFARPALAAKWDIVPSLSIGATYSDNLFLASDELKQGGWVTQATPGISIVGTGPGMRFTANYAPEVIHNARGREATEVHQRLNATGHAELAKQLLFVDTGARADQYNVSLLAPLTTSNVNATGNRTTARTFFVTPYLAGDFGSVARGEARFTYSVANSDSTAVLPDSKANRVNLRLASGPAYKRLTWNLAYSKESIKYETQQVTDTEVITASARRLITSTVGLLATAGYESYDYPVIGQPSKGSTWSAGLDWTPTSRTRLAATAGQRVYGDAYSLDFRHRTRLTTWSAGYSENVTTTRSELFIPATTNTAGYLNQLFISQFPDSVARQKAVEQFIAQTGLPQSLNAPLNFFSNQPFLVKRWLASTGILGVRNVLMANVFRETREVLVGSVVLPGTGDFAPSNVIIQTGTSLTWNSRMTAQTAWNLQGAYSRSEFRDTGQVSNLVTAGTGLTRQFQPWLTGALHYRRQQSDSDQSALNYTENAVLATLHMRF